LGKLLAILVDDKDDIAAFANFKDDGPAAAPAAPVAAAPTPAAAAPTPAAAAPAAAKSSAPASSGDRIFISPMAQNMANA